MEDSDELPSDRANRIADAVEEIVENVSRLRETQQLSRSEYKAEENADIRDSVERKFEKLTAATLDIASELLKQERGAVPNHRKQTFTALEEEGIITTDLAKRMRESVGFRDVLAHSYGPIINDDIVYDALQNSLERYSNFIDAVNDYLSDPSNSRSCG